MFEKFAAAYPIESENAGPIDVERLAHFVKQDLGVNLPAEIAEFWRKFGAGYFGDKVLYVFGDGSGVQPRESFQEWNKKDFWPLVYPSPKDGGPVFFAETCFGDQLGFRWEGERCVYVLFSVDTFEAFAVANSGEELFGSVLTDKYALLDEGRYEAVIEKLGPLRSGMHYAPILSPFLGGTGEVDNFGIETPNVHFRTAIAAFSAKGAAAV